MAKYLFTATYTAAGAAGVLKEGGTARRAAVESLVASVGGSVEAQYWGFGERDYFLIAEVPDNAAAAALSLTVGASGAAHVATVPLLTPEEIDEASRRRVSYRPPGA